MYVKLDMFDYSALISAIIAINGEDMPLTREAISKTLKDFISKIEVSAPVPPEGVPLPLIHYVNDHLCGPETDFIDPDEMWRAIADSLYVAGLAKAGTRGQLFEIFENVFGVIENGEEAFIDMDASQGIDLLNKAYHYLECCRGETLTSEEYLIKTALYDQLKENELQVVRFRILDIDGAQVKYGNNLITFPVILAEVLE